MDASVRPGRKASAKKQRGAYEHPPGSNVWWILYYDQFGKRHREKVGPKGLAISAYQKRKTEIREGKVLPEKIAARRQAVLFEDMLTTYLEEYSKVNKRSYKTDLAMAAESYEKSLCLSKRDGSNCPQCQQLHQSGLEPGAHQGRSS